MIPELPDVEIFKKYLDRHALHKRIDHIEVKNNRILQHVSQKALNEHLSGTTLTKSERWGRR